MSSRPPTRPDLPERRPASTPPPDPLEDVTARLLPAEHGYLHCGPHGAGHFVKMVHNGIEYGLMAAYAEGFAVLHKADIGLAALRPADAENTPLSHPEHYSVPDRYHFEVAELWRRGQCDLVLVARRDRARPSWSDPALAGYAGRVSGFPAKAAGSVMAGRSMRGRARIRADGGPLRAVLVARRERFRRPDPVGYAPQIRRSRRAARRP